MNKELIEKINKKFSCSQKYQLFPDYITDINFPCFKGLESNSTVKFNFPLTVLVGENGCGKSSVLQALQNTPEGNSFTQRWFSTTIDPIPEEPRAAYWYSYYSKDANQIVQVVKQRIKKDKNPDYWEPGRPVVKYGMDKFEETKTPKPGASKTRWNGTKRNVLYMDFRAEITAFDKYFYFGDVPNSQTLKSKQDYLRYWSPYLKAAIDGTIGTNYTYRNKQKIFSIEELSDEEIKIVSDILDKSYKHIKIISHSFYKKRGESVYFTLDSGLSDFSGKYTEAFAGSGESAVAKLVHKVYQVQNGSLVLLDEPEVSLHPGAQKRLLDFLLSNILEKGIQVVISSHSPSIVEELPPDAIVVLNKSANGKFVPKNNVPAEIAFSYIGHQTGKKKILVEDRAAKLLIEKVLDFIDPKAKQSITVEFHNGGSEDLYKEAVVLSRNNENKIFFILDGDKNTNINIPEEILNTEVDEYIDKITHIGLQKLSFSADSGKKDQLTEEKKKYLSYLKNFMYFFPTNDPEQIMWEATTVTKPNEGSEINDYKELFKDFASDEYGDSCAESIFHVQKKFCNKLDKNNESILYLTNLLKSILDMKND